MALNIVNASLAGGTVPADELLQTVANLEAQLASLYEEREHAAGSQTSDDELVALYEAKQRLAEATAQEYERTIDGLDAQLASLYDERAEAGDREAAIEGLAEQLASHYAAQEANGGRSYDDLAQTVTNFEAQLAALYSAQEEQGVVASLGGTEAELVRTVLNFEAQLASLYAEKLELSPEAIMVESLEAQVGALLDEKMELEAALARERDTVARTKDRARSLVEAMLDTTMSMQ